MPHFSFPFLSFCRAFFSFSLHCLLFPGIFIFALCLLFADLFHCCDVFYMRCHWYSLTLSMLPSTATYLSLHLFESLFSSDISVNLTYFFCILSLTNEEIVCMSVYLSTQYVFVDALHLYIFYLDFIYWIENVKKKNIILHGKIHWQLNSMSYISNRVRFLWVFEYLICVRETVACSLSIFGWTLVVEVPFETYNGHTH